VIRYPGDIQAPRQRYRDGSRELGKFGAVRIADKQNRVTCSVGRCDRERRQTLAAAYVAAFWCLMREGRRERMDVDALSSLAFWAIAGAIIGAKVLMVVRDLPEYVSNPSGAFS
jgi:prolipoprotein diacylglyceryl transferase